MKYVKTFLLACVLFSFFPSESMKRQKSVKKPKKQKEAKPLVVVRHSLKTLASFKILDLLKEKRFACENLRVLPDECLRYMGLLGSLKKNIDHLLLEEDIKEEDQKNFKLLCYKLIELYPEKLSVLVSAIKDVWTIRQYVYSVYEKKTDDNKKVGNFDKIPFLVQIITPLLSILVDLKNKEQLSKKEHHLLEKLARKSIKVNSQSLMTLIIDGEIFDRKQLMDFLGDACTHYRSKLPFIEYLVYKLNITTKELISV